MSNKRAQAYCLSKGQLPHFECSAKDGANVEVAFEGMMVEFLVRYSSRLLTAILAIARQALAQDESEIDYFDPTINTGFPIESGGCSC